MFETINNGEYCLLKCQDCCPFLSQLFNFMDANRDRKVTKEEILDANREVFKEILSVLDEREELEDDEEQEDEEEVLHNVNDIPSKGQSSYFETNKSEL